MNDILMMLLIVTTAVIVVVTGYLIFEYLEQGEDQLAKRKPKKHSALHLEGC